MIKFKQPGFRGFIAYIFGFIFLTLLIYLAIPFFFNYEKNKIDIEKKIYSSFGLNINLTERAKYNFFPSPRLNLYNAEILHFSNGANSIGSTQKLILRIPFNQLARFNFWEFNSADFISAVINIKISEIGDFQAYLNNFLYDKPVKLTKSKINLLNKENLLFSVALKKLNISKKNLLSKLNLRGKIFDTKLKAGYYSKNINNEPASNIAIGLPEVGLSIKSTINIEKEDKKARYGRTSISFPNNKFYFDYKLKENIVSISSSSLINNYLKGGISGDIIFSPFLDFDLIMDIDLIKFKNVLNSQLIRNKGFLSKFLPVDKKINGALKLVIKKIKSSSNIINRGEVILEFRNGIIIVKKTDLNINKIGHINISGKIEEQKGKETFLFTSNINLENEKAFYSRFLVPKKNRVNLKPIKLVGKINMKSYELNIVQATIDDQELSSSNILKLNEKIKEILTQGSINDTLKYSNLRKTVQSFFIVN